MKVGATRNRIPHVSGKPPTADPAAGAPIRQGVPSRQQSHSCWIVCGARGHRNGDIGGETTWSLSRRSSTTAGSNSPNHRFPGSVAPAGTWAARRQSSRG